MNTIISQYFKDHHPLLKEYSNIDLSQTEINETSTTISQVFHSIDKGILASGHSEDQIFTRLYREYTQHTINSDGNIVIWLPFMNYMIDQMETVLLLASTQYPDTSKLNDLLEVLIEVFKYFWESYLLSSTSYIKKDTFKTQYYRKLISLLSILMNRFFKKYKEAKGNLAQILYEMDCLWATFLRQLILNPSFTDEKNGMDWKTVLILTTSEFNQIYKQNEILNDIHFIPHFYTLLILFLLQDLVDEKVKIFNVKANGKKLALAEKRVEMEVVFLQSYYTILPHWVSSSLIYVENIQSMIEIWAFIEGDAILNSLNTIKKSKNLLFKENLTNQLSLVSKLLNIAPIPENILKAILLTLDERHIACTSIFNPENHKDNKSVFLKHCIVYIVNAIREHEATIELQNYLENHFKIINDGEEFWASFQVFTTALLTMYNYKCNQISSDSHHERMSQVYEALIDLYKNMIHYGYQTHKQSLVHVLKNLLCIIRRCDIIWDPSLIIFILLESLSISGFDIIAQSFHPSYIAFQLMTCTDSNSKLLLLKAINNAMIKEYVHKDELFSNTLIGLMKMLRILESKAPIYNVINMKTFHEIEDIIDYYPLNGLSELKHVLNKYRHRTPSEERLLINGASVALGLKIQVTQNDRFSLLNPQGNLGDHFKPDQLLYPDYVFNSTICHWNEVISLIGMKIFNEEYSNFIRSIYPSEIKLVFDEFLLYVFNHSKEINISMDGFIDTLFSAFITMENTHDFKYYPFQSFIEYLKKGTFVEMEMIQNIYGKLLTSLLKMYDIEYCRSSSKDCWSCVSKYNLTSDMYETRVKVNYEDLYLYLFQILINSGDTQSQLLESLFLFSYASLECKSSIITNILSIKGIKENNEESYMKLYSNILISLFSLEREPFSLPITGTLLINFIFYYHKKSSTVQNTFEEIILKLIHGKPEIMDRLFIQILTIFSNLSFVSFDLLFYESLFPLIVQHARVLKMTIKHLLMKKSSLFFSLVSKKYMASLYAYYEDAAIKMILEKENKRDLLMGIKERSRIISNKNKPSKVAKKAPSIQASKEVTFILYWALQKETESLAFELILNLMMKAFEYLLCYLKSNKKTRLAEFNGQEMKTLIKWFLSISKENALSLLNFSLYNIEQQQRLNWIDGIFKVISLYIILLEEYKLELLNIKSMEVHSNVPGKRKYEEMMDAEEGEMKIEIEQSKKPRYKRKDAQIQSLETSATFLIEYILDTLLLTQCHPTSATSLYNISTCDYIQMSLKSFISYFFSDSFMHGAKSRSHLWKIFNENLLAVCKVVRNIEMHIKSDIASEKSTFSKKMKSFKKSQSAGNTLTESKIDLKEIISNSKIQIIVSLMDLIRELNGPLETNSYKNFLITLITGTAAPELTFPSAMNTTTTTTTKPPFLEYILSLLQNSYRFKYIVPLMNLISSLLSKDTEPAIKFTMNRSLLSVHFYTVCDVIEDEYLNMQQVSSIEPDVISSKKAKYRTPEIIQAMSDLMDKFFDACSSEFKERIAFYLWDKFVVQKDNLKKQFAFSHEKIVKLFSLLLKSNDDNATHGLKVKLVIRIKEAMENNDKALMIPILVPILCLLLSTNTLLFGSETLSIQKILVWMQSKIKSKDLPLDWKLAFCQLISSTLFNENYSILINDIF